MAGRQPDAASERSLTVILHIVGTLTLCSLNGWQIPSACTAVTMSPLPITKLRTNSRVTSVLEKETMSSETASCRLGYFILLLKDRFLKLVLRVCMYLYTVFDQRLKRLEEGIIL